MLVEIPVTFEYKGHTYQGKLNAWYLTEVSEETPWSLTVDDYHWGILRIQRGQWVFHSNSRVFDQPLIDELSNIIVAWIG